MKKEQQVNNNTNTGAVVENTTNTNTATNTTTATTMDYGKFAKFNATNVTNTVANTTIQQANTGYIVPPVMTQQEKQQVRYESIGKFMSNPANAGQYAIDNNNRVRTSNGDVAVVPGVPYNITLIHYGSKGNHDVCEVFMESTELPENNYINNFIGQSIPIPDSFSVTHSVLKRANTNTSGINFNDNKYNGNSEFANVFLQILKRAEEHLKTHNVEGCITLYVTPNIIDTVENAKDWLLLGNKHLSGAELTANDLNMFDEILDIYMRNYRKIMLKSVFDLSANDINKLNGNRAKINAIVASKLNNIISGLAEENRQKQEQAGVSRSRKGYNNRSNGYNNNYGNNNNFNNQQQPTINYASGWNNTGNTDGNNGFNNGNNNATGWGGNNATSGWSTNNTWGNQPM